MLNSSFSSHFSLPASSWTTARFSDDSSLEHALKVTLGFHINIVFVFDIHYVNTSFQRHTFCTNPFSKLYHQNRFPYSQMCCDHLHVSKVLSNANKYSWFYTENHWKSQTKFAITYLC